MLSLRISGNSGTIPLNVDIALVHTAQAGELVRTRPRDAIRQQQRLTISGTKGFPETPDVVVDNIVVLAVLCIFVIVHALDDWANVDEGTGPTWPPDEMGLQSMTMPDESVAIHNARVYNRGEAIVDNGLDASLQLEYLPGQHPNHDLTNGRR
ncbi:hypothetical protein F66182_2124 [Fusarium sp. NRRL 66182]|nr:hypothetical protein F66182_2124 [Fusarium sp. NRRL 66182]